MHILQISVYSLLSLQIRAEELFRESLGGAIHCYHGSIAGCLHVLQKQLDGVAIIIADPSGWRVIQSQRTEANLRDSYEGRINNTFRQRLVVGKKYETHLKC